jgi:transglutaminase superfamily protein
MARVAKFLRLSTADKLLLGRCLLTVVMVRLGLSLLSYRALRRWLPRGTDGAAAAGAAAQRIVWGVDVTSRLVPGATCLVKAFAAQLILARAGYQSQLRIGVGNDPGGKFIAHAWLMCGDRVLLGGAPHELRRYVRLADFGSEPL